MTKPLVFLVLVFCLGIIVSLKIKIGFLPVYFAMFLLLVFYLIFLKAKSYSWVYLCLFTFLIGALIFKNSLALPKCHISHYVYYKDSNLCSVRGVVTGEPYLKNNRLSFIFKPESILFNDCSLSCCGAILVYAKAGRNPKYGEELILKGKIYRPYKFVNSGRTSYRDFLNNKGIYSIMQAQVILETGNPNRGFPIKRFSLWLKNKTENIIHRYCPDLAAGILSAMVLGEKRDIPPLINSSMVKSGTVHILVVSGFNVGIVAFIINVFLKLMRMNRRTRVMLSIPLLILYCLMTGATNPVVRATVMGCVFMSSYLFKREPDIYNSCALSALLILLFNPNQLFDIGFQLSFVSVISIVYLYPRLKALFKIETVKLSLFRFVMNNFLVSFSAWLGTMGLIAYYFKIFSPVTVLANIFIVPLAALITLCGFSLLFMGLCLPCFAPVFATASAFAVSLLLEINRLVIKLPGAYFYLP